METKEIISLIETKMASGELWAEAFFQLDTMDDIGQNAIVSWMGKDIEESLQWDENLAEDAGKLELMGDAAWQSTKELREKKAQFRRQKTVGTEQIMVTHFDEGFLASYKNFTSYTRSQIRKAYKPFGENPSHIRFDFKPVRPRSNVYAARIDRYYRMLGCKEGDEIVWFWVGSSYEYEELFA